jgi:calcineurin-like phosphoesterase family protein
MFDFFSADWHLFHNAIIEHTERPWKSPNQMNQQLVYEHNQIVSPADDFWLIGDVCLMSPEYVGRIRKEVEKFNGRKHLVLGNHDDWKAQNYLNAGFTTVHTAMWFEREGFHFYMMHDPSEYAVIEKDPKAILLCGHIHRLFKHLLPAKRVINVGVDVWNYRPVPFNSIMNLLKEHKLWQEQ